jgi:hypothetical protein
MTTAAQADKKLFMDPTLPAIAWSYSILGSGGLFKRTERRGGAFAFARFLYANR